MSRALQDKIQKRIATAEKHGGILDLSDCGLSAIPQKALSIKNVQTLRLNTDPDGNSDYKNTISNIPDDIVNFESLEFFNASNNQISEIPGSLLQLKKLQRIDLSGNKIKYLPPDLLRLPRLTEINLENNEIENVPPEIVAQGIKAINNFFKALTREDYLYEAKLLLVGQPRVGKTTISKALTSLNYKFSNEESTHGIRIKHFEFPKTEMPKPVRAYMKKDTFRFNIWDFGGQEIYRATHQFFLTKRSLYLLVTESRKEDSYEEFIYWLDLIKLLGDKSPVIIVLNKIDEPIKELPIADFKKQYPNLIGISKVSCHDDFKETINALKQEIKDVIIKSKLLPHIGTALPKAWVEVREELEKLSKSGCFYIDAKQYFQICSTHKINEVEALHLSDFFHDLGVVLHFSRDLQLKDTVFLDHEWVTKGVYKIFDNRTVIANKGVFSETDLNEIWSERSYKDKQRELLSLIMNDKFQLCFQLNEKHYLFPQLLPVDEKEFEWASQKDNLLYECRYKFMPKGILTRLIVKQNKYIKDGIYWRYGVLIEYDNTRAIIRENYLERKLSIKIEGQNRRELLGIIRKSIEEINKDFGNVEISEMIPCNCTICKKTEVPYFYDYKFLRRLRQADKSHVQCHESLQDVPVLGLIDDTILADRIDVSIDSTKHLS